MLLLLLSHFSRVRLCVTPEMAAYQAPPSMGFSRQEYWSGVPLPSPRRGSIMIKSNPTAPGWVNHKLKTIISQSFFHRSESSEPHIRIPSLGVWHQEEELPEHLFFFLNHQFNFMNWSHVTHCQTSLKFLANYTEPLFSR